MIQSTTMPISQEEDKPPAAPAIDETQSIPKIASPVHIGGAAMIMGFLASQEIYKLDLRNPESCEGFILGISICASALESMYSECDGPALPFSW